MSRYSFHINRLLIVLLAGLAWTTGAQPIPDSSWMERVRTVALNRGGVEGEPPLVTLEGGERLLLSFDVLVRDGELPLPHRPLRQPLA